MPCARAYAVTEQIALVNSSRAAESAIPIPSPCVEEELSGGTKKLFYTANGKKKAAIDGLTAWLDDSDDGVLADFAASFGVADALVPATKIVRTAAARGARRSARRMLG